VQLVVGVVVCIRGERQRQISGRNSSLKSSLMMDGWLVGAGAGALGGELLLTMCVGGRSSSGLQMMTGSLVGRGVMTCGGGELCGVLESSRRCFLDSFDWFVSGRGMMV
jgi:hypothetical protein